MKPLARPPDPTLSPDQQSTLAATLDRVLQSPAFRNSKQSQKFLRYAVDHSVAGSDDELKERTIGIEVFGRDAGYETADDPVVRIRATEVRKRLAQYYQESAEPGEVRLEIPHGSYRVEFHWPEAAPVVVPVEPPKRDRRWWTLAAALGVVILAVVVFLLNRPTPRPQTALDRFWQPVLSSTKPVLLYCGQPVVYFLSPDVHRRYRASAPAEERKGAYVVKLAPDEVLHGRDLVPVTDQFVGIGNAHTAASLTALFAARGKPVEIRYANDLSFSDLRGAPSVLIGAFSNLWTLEMTGQSRFVFEQADGIRRIRDRAGSRTWQLEHQDPDGKTPEDYAVVSRLFDSATGQILISAAGITQYGTRVAGEFLTDPSRLAEAVAQAPPDWERRNMQVVLHTAVYKGTPAPPKVVVAHFW